MLSVISFINSRCKNTYVSQLILKMELVLIFKLPIPLIFLQNIGIFLQGIKVSLFTKILSNKTKSSKSLKNWNFID